MKTSFARILFVAAAAAFTCVAGCSSHDGGSSAASCPVGGEGCACTPGGGCDQGLSCFSYHCVDSGAKRVADAGDSGGVDAGAKGPHGQTGSPGSGGSSTDGGAAAGSDGGGAIGRAGESGDDGEVSKTPDAAVLDAGKPSAAPLLAKCPYPFPNATEVATVAGGDHPSATLLFDHGVLVAVNGTACTFVSEETTIYAEPLAPNGCRQHVDCGGCKIALAEIQRDLGFRLLVEEPDAGPECAPFLDSDGTCVPSSNSRTPCPIDGGT
jgi:hypothetical protein